MKIHWHGFLEYAVQQYPKEACGFLYSHLPYNSQEEWHVFMVANVSKTPTMQWIPDKKGFAKIKKLAIQIGLVKIGNVHTHPLVQKPTDVYIEAMKLPSDEDLRYAKRVNDIVRGILVVDKDRIYGSNFHDKYGNSIGVLVKIPIE